MRSLFIQQLASCKKTRIYLNFGSQLTVSVTGPLLSLFGSERLLSLTPFLEAVDSCAADSLLTQWRTPQWRRQLQYRKLSHSHTHLGDRLNRRRSPITTAYSPSSPFSHPSDIMGRHLSLACRRKSCKDCDSINVGGYYIPFQQYVPPNPCAIHPWWIQAPDQISSQSSFGFTLCFGFIPDWYILFLAP